MYLPQPKTLSAQLLSDAFIRDATEPSKNDWAFLNYLGELPPNVSVQIEHDELETNKSVTKLRWNLLRGSGSGKAAFFDLSPALWRKLPLTLSATRAYEPA